MANQNAQQGVSLALSFTLFSRESGAHDHTYSLPAPLAVDKWSAIVMMLSAQLTAVGLLGLVLGLVTQRS